jgi:AcrR family transcriptional regulator
MSNAIDVLAASTPDTVEPCLQRRAAATRARILAEAAKAFDARGYRAASINDVIVSGGFTKGGLFHHFPSKQSIAQHLVECWSLAVEGSFADAAATGGGATEQLREVFLDLARKVDGDVRLRAGMKLTLDSAVDGGHQAYREWVDLTSDLVGQGIAAAVIGDDVRTRRFAWNLCAGFVGAVNVFTVLCEAVDLPTRVDDVVISYLESCIPAAPCSPLPVERR